jgi:hypothetical protein
VGVGAPLPSSSPHRAEDAELSNAVFALRLKPWLADSRFPFRHVEWRRYGEEVEGFVLPGITYTLRDSLQVGVGLPLPNRGDDQQHETVVRLTKQF